MSSKKGFKYPRLTILILVLVATLFLFSYEGSLIASVVDKTGLFGPVVAGFMYAFSFTAFAATGILLQMGETGNIFTLAIIAGFGSLIGDLLILKLARISFEREFKMLYKEQIFKTITRPMPRSLQHILKVILAMIIIASPLPDEAGVTLLANGYQLPKWMFSIISLTLNTMGIYLILYAGKML